jgi:chemotaxis protein methyltransferase CheR
MQLTPDTLHALIQQIRQLTGLALTADKEYLVRHRLGPVVRSCGFGGYEELLLRLQSGGATRIQDAVIEAITTKETSFFRDAWLFDAILQHVLPQIAGSARKGDATRRRIRILSAGSSMGQEAYSLAMLTQEFIDHRRQDWSEIDFSITAIDISAEAVDVARTGLYSQKEVDRGLGEARLRRHLRREGAGWAIVEPLRRLVQFRTHNLLTPLLQLGQFDLILCRNVLIYFDEATRAKVCRSLVDVMRPGGWFAVGSAESLHGIGIDLESVRFDRAFFYRTSGDER